MKEAKEIIVSLNVSLDERFFVTECDGKIVFLLRENDGDESSFHIPLCRGKSFKVLR